MIEGQYNAGSGDPLLDDYTVAWPNLPKIVYEINATSGRIEPRLHVWIDSPISLTDSGSSTPGHSASASSDARGIGQQNIGLLWALQQGPWVLAPDTLPRNSAIVVEPCSGRISDTK